jgi:hypothetical protein
MDMAEQLVVVCDVCGAPADETVSIRVGSRNLQKDLCTTHLAELLEGARTPKRGRRRASAPASPKRTSARRRTAKRSTAKAKRGTRTRRRRTAGSGGEGSTASA